jgi:hypothetical protein
MVLTPLLSTVSVVLFYGSAVWYRQEPAVTTVARRW